MYHRQVEAGGSAAFWEQFGSEGTLADRLRFCDLDPLRPLFARYLKPGAVMLEGGCGRGQYVAYYTRQGCKVIGLDFAREWLTAIHREIPALTLCAGDVGALPFAAATFDVYYSGGVVEHFEAGAEGALAEARRVLKPRGTLLISVPYFSPLRRVLARARSGEWRRVTAPRVDNGDSEGRGRFYQYAYQPGEFEHMLEAAGLHVLETQGYAILWGLYDVDAVRLAAERFERSRATAGPPKAGHYRSHTQNTPAQATSGETPAPPSLLKRLLVAEDCDVPALGWLVKAGRWACANMMMYVCTPDGAAA